MSISAKRVAQIELKSNASGMDRGVADARKKLRSIEKDARGLEKMLAKPFRTIGTGALLGVGMAAGGGIVSHMTGLVTGVLDVETALTRLQIAGNIGTRDMADFRAELMRVSNATGVSRAELVKGAAQYVAITGDAAGAKVGLELFAEVANATGGSMADITATAAAMKQNLKIDPHDFRAAFDILVTQGKAGAIELSDLAKQLANVAPAFAEFAGSRSVGGLAEMGAMLQVVREKFGDADQAATGFRGMLTEMQRHMKELKRAGVDIIDPKTGKMRDALSIIKEISHNKTLMKPGGLLGALGEEKAARAMSAVIENLDEIDKLQNDSINSDAVHRDNLAWQASAAGKMALTWETIKNKVAEIFTPERINAFADALMRVGGWLGKLIDALGKILDDIDTASMTPEQRAAKLSAAHNGDSPEQLDAAASALDKQGNAMFDAGGGAASSFFGGLVGDIARVGTPALPTGDQARMYSGGDQLDAASQMRSLARSRRSYGAQPDFTPGAGSLAQNSVFNLRIGAEPVVAATNNSMDHRRQSGPR